MSPLEVDDKPFAYAMLMQRIDIMVFVGRVRRAATRHKRGTTLSHLAAQPASALDQIPAQ